MISYLPLAHVAARARLQTTNFITGYRVFFAESLETFIQHVQRARPTVFGSVLHACAGPSRSSAPNVRCARSQTATGSREILARRGRGLSSLWAHLPASESRRGAWSGHDACVVHVRSVRTAPPRRIGAPLETVDHEARRIEALPEALQSAILAERVILKQ